VRLPCVILVRVAQDEEPPELSSDTVAVRAVRVREPIPACERIRILRPHLVLVGRDVGAWALPDLIWAARAAGAELIDLGLNARRGAPPSWFKDALATAIAERSKGG
jgi:hypothetical protein